LESNSLVDELQQRREQFLLEWEKPLKCEKCGARFRLRHKFEEHKNEFHL
jgi:uncharacterized C2H2 Zn-finger protein